MKKYAVVAAILAALVTLLAVSASYAAIGSPVGAGGGTPPVSTAQAPPPTQPAPAVTPLPTTTPAAEAAAAETKRLIKVKEADLVSTKRAIVREGARGNWSGRGGVSSLQRQLNGIKGQIRSLQSRLSALENRVSYLEKRVDRSERNQKENPLGGTWQSHKRVYDWQQLKGFRTEGQICKMLEQKYGLQPVAAPTAAPTAPTTAPTQPTTPETQPTQPPAGTTPEALPTEPQVAPEEGATAPPCDGVEKAPAKEPKKKAKIEKKAPAKVGGGIDWLRLLFAGCFGLIGAGFIFGVIYLIVRSRRRNAYMPPP